MKENIVYEDGWLRLVEKRLNVCMSDVMNDPVKDFSNYGNYFDKFKQFKVLFYIGKLIGIFPETFYKKYVER